MVLTEDVYLPTDEELNHKEIPVTTNFMLASAMWLGKYCDNECKEYMLCRNEEQDPRKCLKDGSKVTDCGIKFFQKVKHTCGDELEWYTKCIDYSGSEPEFKRCRDAQAIFDGCMSQKGFERADFGYFSMLRVHHTDRPKVKRIVPLFPDSTPGYDYKDGKVPEEYTTKTGSTPWMMSWLSK